MMTRCQICGKPFPSWQISQIDLNILTLRYYKLQSCEPCQHRLEVVIVQTLRELERPTETPPD